MRAARVYEYGHSDAIRIEDVAMPKAAAGDVLVRIDAAGVNPLDWKIREGMRAKVIPRSFPFTLGQDFAGQVIALGEDVKDIEAGNDVYGFASTGAYAEYALVAPDKIATKPESIDALTAAGLPTTGLTAMQVVRLVKPRPDKTILIHGAGGGVGSIATQLCVLRGAHVIATAAGRDLEYLCELGVEQVIDYKVEQFDEVVKEIDAAIDLVGGVTLHRTYPVMTYGGTVVTTVGPVDERRARAIGVDAIQFVMQPNAADLRELAHMVDTGAVKPRGTRVLPFHEVKQAQDLNQYGRTSEKVVLAVH